MKNIEIFLKSSRLLLESLEVSCEIICTIDDYFFDFFDRRRDFLSFSFADSRKYYRFNFSFLALQFKILRLRHVSMVGNFLLANMTILFLPPAVGIMDKFHVIAPYLLPIVLIIVGAIVINVIVIAVVVHLIKNRFEGDYGEGETRNV